MSPLFENNKEYQKCKKNTPDINELNQVAQQIDEKIPAQSHIQNLIDSIQYQIQGTIPDCQKRKLLTKQLKELEELRKIYEVYNKTPLTNNTNTEIFLLFQEANLENMKEKKAEIENTIQKEKKALKDTFLFGKKTVRDQVEKHIDFKGDSFFDIKGNLFNETWWENSDIKKFLHLFTIEYVNILRKNGEDINSISKNTPLHINTNELSSILKTVKNKLGNTTKDSIKNIKFSLKDGVKKTVDFRKGSSKNQQKKTIYKGKINENKTTITNSSPKKKEEIPTTKNTEIITIEPNNKNQNIIEKQPKENTEIIKTPEQKLEYLGFPSSKKGIIDYQIKKGIIKNEQSLGAGNIGPTTTKNIELSYNIRKEAEKQFTGKVSQKLLTAEKEGDILLGDFIQENGLPENSKKIAINLIKNNILGKTAYQVEFKNGQKGNITLTTEYINKNQKEILKNIGNVITYILRVESHGGKKYAKNTDQTGWKNGSTAKGPFQILDGYKGGKRHPRYNRKKGMYTTFEVMLRYIKISQEKHPKYVDIAYDNPGIISPLDLTFEQSINLFLTYLVKKTVANECIPHLVAAIATGNEYAIKKLYENVHNTCATKATKKVMDRELLAMNK